MYKKMLWADLSALQYMWTACSARFTAAAAAASASSFPPLAYLQYEFASLFVHLYFWNANENARMELDYTVYLLVWCVPLASVHYIHSCDVRVLLGALVCIFSLLSVLALAMTFHIITAYTHTYIPNNHFTIHHCGFVVLLLPSSPLLLLLLLLSSSSSSLPLLPLLLMLVVGILYTAYSFFYPLSHTQMCVKCMA